jgi:hypothetical protein
VNYFGAIALLVMVIDDEYKIEFIKGSSLFHVGKLNSSFPVLR